MDALRSRPDQGPTPAAATDSSARRHVFCSVPGSRLSSQKRFEEIREKGEKRVGKYLVVWVLPSEDGVSHLGATAAKRTFHLAVQRNRAKRLMREAFRLLRPEFQGAWDVSLVARARVCAPATRMQDVMRELRTHCQTLGLIATDAAVPTPSTSNPTPSGAAPSETPNGHA